MPTKYLRSIINPFLISKQILKWSYDRLMSIW